MDVGASTSAPPVRAAKGRQHVHTGVITSTHTSGRQHVCTGVIKSARVSARAHGCRHVYTGVKCDR
ncbi:hypothetical protein T484DRAFT_1959973 [Baffinella frigidus]|nr:hypothetical protein T484DRAFT_1959973 [Cryptophyta sp. CCMP2293]